MINTLTRMKMLLVLLFLLFGLLATCSAWEKLEMNQGSVTFEDVTTCPVAWFIKIWDEAGYATPQSGVAFHWPEFLTPLDPADDDHPQPYDVVEYTDADGDIVGGLVFAYDINDADNVTIRAPFPGGASIYKTISMSTVKGFLRPHKATKAKMEI